MYRLTLEISLITYFLFATTAVMKFKPSSDARHHLQSKTTQTSKDLDVIYKNPKIVILGSSTATGSGAWPYSKSWAGLLENWLKSRFDSYELINLAGSGYSTHSVIATGNPERNITKALSLNPDIILVNLPTNNSWTPQDITIRHYYELKQAANDAGVLFFLTTTQPRNFKDSESQQRHILFQETQRIRQEFGNLVIDIYDELTDFDDDLRLKRIYDAGDGAHPNNEGHKYIYSKVIEKISPLIDTTDLAGLSATTNEANTFVGMDAGRSISSGNKNVFIGFESGIFNDAEENTFVGASTGLLNAGKQNTFIGQGAGAGNQTGVGNVFLGYKAGIHETGSNKLYIANNNTANPLIYGDFEQKLVRINGRLELSEGLQGLLINDANTLVGLRAGDSITTGNKNTFLGFESGIFNNAKDNTFIGTFSGRFNQGSRNTFIGQGAGASSQSGSGNVFLGYNAGINETGSNKLYIDNSNTSSPLVYGDFNSNVVAVNGRLGVGIQHPERPIHLRATDAIFRIDRDREDPGFAIVRYNTNFNAVWKSFYFYTSATALNQGKFIIADWGTNVSGSSTPRFVIANNGNIGIGDFLYTDPSQKLTVQGNALATAYLVTSDKRFKKDIQTIPQAMNRLNKLNGVSYRYETQKFAERGLPQGQNLGLIAQEVEKVFPELVVEDAEGYKAVNYDGLIPVLIEALKTQNNKLEVQQQEIAELKQELKILKSQGQFSENKKAQLFQNQPNPFDRSTVIRYYLPESTSSAAIIITDLQGKEVSRQTIEQQGEGSITLQAGSLSNGLYLYTLVVDGELMDTKRMLIEQ